ncbi:MAG: RNA polymerase sigma factor [Oscillospiraceae bacterium]|nr:RNA polymerase sigma factor [Oscillospiraceae bacterium]
MDDESILQLFFQRREDALKETQAKYARLCLRVANGILSDERDAEECVNDTWLRAWNAIPPERPARLSAWLAKVTRNLAITRLRGRAARKRGGGELPLLLDELAECLPGGEDPQRELEKRELGEAVDHFLSALDRKERDLFTARFFFGAAPGELAERTGLTESAVLNRLRRTRAKLKKRLKEEGLA